MLRTKVDVDRHVQGLLRKVKSDNERNLRCFNIAQLYFKVQDYESARYYVLMYLSVRYDSPSAHKLLGQALEHLGNKEKALEAYKKSLELEANQADLILKMCELLCDKQVVFDPAKAHYWVERASTMFPHSPVVFMLKEKLLSSGSTKNCEDFENLFQSELKARPTDVAVRVKLLRLYVDTDRVDVAFNHAFDIEFKQEPSNNIPWYHCLNHICESYLKVFPTACNWEFYTRWLTALDRLCSLCMSETLMQPTNLVESTEVVYNFDQVLYKGSHLQGKSPECYKELLKHLSAQLAFHIAVLLLKRAKKESSLWKEVKRMVSPLLLFASKEFLVPEGAWNFANKDIYQKCLKSCMHNAQCRIVQAGHVLCSLSKDSHSEKLFLDKVLHFTSSSNWRNQVYQKVFRTLENNTPNTSHLVTANFYNETPHKLPSNLSLKSSYFVSSFENAYMGSLHHLVWLGLQLLTNSGSPVSCEISPNFYTTFFKSLQFTVNNLNNTGVETLNQLDVDSFLYAAVFCAGAVIDDQKSNGYHSPHIFPPDITPLLCTTEQAKWWTNACSIVKVGMPVMGFKSKVYDIRHNLQRGIEVVRGEGMQLPLLVSLARTLANRATKSDCEEEKKKSCESRALHLWKIAIPQLEKLADLQSVMMPTLKLFEYPIKELMPEEVTTLLEEGRYFVGCHYMKAEQYEKAIETFRTLRTPQSLFNQALIYQKLAKDQLTSLRGEEITSEIRSRHVVMAAKARDCLYSVRDMIKGDRNHPLQQKLKCKLIEIDDLLSRFEPENDVTERDGYMSDTSPSFASGGSPTGDTNTQPHMHSHAHSRNKHFPSSTPNKYYDIRHRSSSADIAELLTVNLNTIELKTQQFILEQNRLVLERLDSMKLEHRTQMEELTNKFNKLETEVKNNLSEIKKEIKRPDLYNMLDEEDYNDDMLHYPNIPFYPQRGAVQAPSTVTYGSTVTPFFSPRVEQMYQNNMGFYNQGALPFPDGQQVSDFLRTMPPTAAQITPSLTHKLNAQNSIAPPAQTLPPPQTLPPAQTLPPPPHATLQTQSVSPLSALQPAHTPQKLAFQMGSHVQPQQSPSSALRTAHTSSINRGPTNVVITTSDTLPTATPSVQPTLSVTIPPQHRLGAVPHNFQIPMPPNIKTVEKSVIIQEDLESDDEVIEHDPIPDFQPIIPLPEEVPVKTGEENETCLFACRAKLFRFVDKQWKERGVGTLKILRDNSTAKCRILMRRDQVHKVCANHFITPDMNLEPMTKSSDNAWVWVANDFADEKVQLEKLSAKFKTVDDKMLFKNVFDKVKASLKESKDATAENLDIYKMPMASSKLTNNEPSGNNFKCFMPNFRNDNTPKTDVSGVNKLDGSEQVGSWVTTGVRNMGGGVTNIGGGAMNMGGGVTNMGGFTILTPPKLKLDDKRDIKAVEEKKPESPLTKFSFKPESTPKIAEENKTARDKWENSFDVSNNKLPDFNTSNSSLTGEKPAEIGGFYCRAPEFFDGTKQTEERKPDRFADLIFKPCSPSVQTTQKQAPKESQFKLDPKNTMPISSQLDFGMLAKGATGFDKLETTPNKGFEGAGSRVFGSSCQTPLNTTNKVLSPKSDSSPVGGEDEFTPTAEFKPVVALPKLVEIKSGEENEVKLFEERAKLMRFCTETKQWKERGIGQMKILKEPTTGTVRLLMRREQVLKVCCNHRLTEDIVLKPMQGSDKALTWAVPQDFSDDTPKSEIFALKFKTAEQGQKFKAEFEKEQMRLSSGLNASNKSSDEPSDDSVVIEPDSSTELSDTNCTAEKPSLAALFQPKAGSWSCDTCLLVNASDKMKCVACDTCKPGAEKQPTNKPAAQPTGNFSFGFIQSNEATTAPGVFSFNTQTNKDTSQFQFGSTGGPPFKFSFGNQLTPASSNLPADTTTTTATTTATITTATITTNNITTSMGFTFGSQSTSQTGPKFAFGSQTFQFTMPSTNVSSLTSKSPKKDEDSESENDEADNSTDHIQFTPVISLPEKVPIITGEENEDILYLHKAKLYRYDSTAKEWKERGCGDVKILKHRETGKVRLLMRRDQVMKLCLNHYLSEDIDMKVKDERSWIWHAADYSDGEMTQEKFSLKFKTPEIAKQFKAAVDKAQAEFLGLNTNTNKSSGAATKYDVDQDNIQSGVVTSDANESADEASPKSFSKFSLSTPKLDATINKDGNLSGGDATKQADDDLEIVYENEVSEEDRKKALALKLPPKFYLYHVAPPCPGCIGCEPGEDDEDEDGTANLSKFEQGKQPAETETRVEAVVEVTSQESGDSFTKPPESSAPLFGGLAVFNSGARTPSNIFGAHTQESTPKSSSFFSQGMTSFAAVDSPKSIFGNVSSVGSTPKTSDTTPAFCSNTTAFPDKPYSFSNLVGGGTSKAFTKSSDFKWEHANAKVFGSYTGSPQQVVNKPKDVDRTGGEDTSDEESHNAAETSHEEHDPQFEPIIPLPSEIEIKTGEEDEDIVFCERAKLYRRDPATKEWKERGIGEFKVLKHRINKTYRFLMRRELVHKVVCNHLITADLKVNKMLTSEQAMCWFAMNLAQDYDKPQLETLAVRFKNKDVAMVFKKTVDSAIADIGPDEC